MNIGCFWLQETDFLHKSDTTRDSVVGNNHLHLVLKSAYLVIEQVNNLKNEHLQNMYSTY